VNAKSGGGVLLVQLMDIVNVLNYPFIVAYFLSPAGQRGTGSSFSACAIVSCIDQFVLSHISV